MKTLHVPEHWPMAWWAGDGSAVKMSCPACGGFSMLVTRSLPDGALSSLACDVCGLSGFDAVQNAFTPPQRAAALPPTAHERQHRESL